MIPINVAMNYIRGRAACALDAVRALDGRKFQGVDGEFAAAALNDLEMIFDLASKEEYRPDPAATTGSVLQEADALVHGDRNRDYGPPREAYEGLAKLWNAFAGTALTPEQVVVMLILMKVNRERYRAKRDNRVDIAGYAEVLDWMVREGGETFNVSDFVWKKPVERTGFPARTVTAFGVDMEPDAASKTGWGG